jgi:hypothetical protein
MTVDLIQLKTEIDNLNNYETEEVRNIIERHSIPYTKNSNGIFINMKSFDNGIINDLKTFIEFSKKSRIILENKSREIDNEKKNINSLIRNNKLPFNVKVKDIDDKDEEKEYQKEYQKILKSSYIGTDDKNKDDEKNQITYYGLSKGKKMNRKMKFSGLKEKILKSLKEKKKKRIHSIDLMISSLIQLDNEENIRKKTKKRRRRKKTKKKAVKVTKDLMDDNDEDMDDINDIDEENNINEDDEDEDDDNECEDDDDVDGEDDDDVDGEDDGEDDDGDEEDDDDDDDDDDDN